ncbi:Gfo/Idh/MocA family oxidoreductase [soil metagenome]
MKLNRRNFLKASGGIALSAASYRRVWGANSRVGMALIGTGRRGREVMKSMLQTGNVDLHVLCDIWDVQRQRAKEELGIKKAFDTFSLEETLARKEVDAVLIATPDHLHKNYALEVLKNGRHLYLEKPATLYFEEGEALKKAVSESGKICQTGTQQRSGSLYKRVKEEFFSGSKILGDIVFVRAVWSDFGWQRRKIEPRPKPDNFQWERFLGPAQEVPYEWTRYDAWRNYKEYGAGILSDLLTHWVDVAQWMMDDANPLNAVTSGGIYYLKDGRTNPDTVNSLIQYKNGWNFTFECSVMPVRNERQSVLFHGTKGKLELFREGYIHTPHGEKPVFVENKYDLNLEHVNNFFDAVKNNKQPSANIDVGLQAVKPSHLAVAAYWSGQRMKFDEQQENIVSAL